MWLGLGSNLGERADALRWAVTRLGEEGAVVECVSSLYATAPQGVASQRPTAATSSITAK